MTERTSDPAFERAGEGYVLLDDGGHVVDANPAARDLLGLDSDVEGTHVSELPAEVHAALARRDVPWDLQAGTEDAQDGRGRPIEVAAMRVEGDGVGGHLLVVGDGEERGLSRRYEGILEASGDGVYTLDPDGNYTYTNRANAELLGYDAAEMVGMSVAEILDSEVIERVEGEIRALLEGEGPGRTVIEHEVITSDGERVPVENHISLLLDDEGEFRGTAGIVRDVRDRKEREEQLERYERIVEAMGDGIYVLDETGDYATVNDYVLELTGYDREELLSAGPSALHDEDDIEAFEEAIRELLDAEDPGVKTVEAGIATADGETVPIEVNLTVLSSDDGEFRGSVGVVRDVSDREERERELEQYETIVETVPEGVAIIDEEGTVVSANETAARMLGYEPEEFVGGSLDRLVEEGVVSEPDVDEYLDTLRGFLTGDAEQSQFDFEVTVDGDTRVLEATLVPRPHDEEFHGVVATIEDVTERRERRRELERYETLLEVMPDTVVVTDTEGRHVEIHGFEGWSGYEKEELIGEHISLTAPEEDVERATQAARELFTDDDLDKVTYEQTVITKDGERIPHENHLALLPPDEDGMIPGSISVLRDISERKAQERALEALNATTRELVAADSREAVVEMTVATAKGVLDLPLAGVWLYEEGEEALVPASYPESDLLPDDPPTFRSGESIAWEAYEAGEARIYDDLEEAENVHNPETSIRGELVAPLGDHGVLLAGATDPDAFGEEERNLAGILGAAVGTALDRLDREREREEQRRELRRKNEQLERFASVLSHDLRNPLNVAHARVRNALNSGSLDGLESADEALVRMNELIEDLLTLAREGRLVGDVEAASISGVAEEAWRSVEAPEASLSVVDDATIEADRARLRELLENLFRNAIEHGGDDVTVRVGSLQGDDAPGGGFYVEDDGPGIPPDEREAVFEYGVTSSEDGTGFGLAIVESIAEAHGWSVSLAEGCDGGARFEFALAGSSERDGP